MTTNQIIILVIAIAFIAACFVLYHYFIYIWRKNLTIGDDILIHVCDFEKDILTVSFNKKNLFENEIILKCMIYEVCEEYLYCKDDDMRVFLIKRKYAKLF